MDYTPTSTNNNIVRNAVIQPRKPYPLALFPPPELFTRLLPKPPQQTRQLRLRRPRRHLLREPLVPTRLLRPHRRRRRRILPHLDIARHLVGIHLRRAHRRRDIARGRIAIVHGRRHRPRSVWPRTVGLLLLLCIRRLRVVLVLVLHRLAVPLAVLVGYEPLFLSAIAPAGHPGI